PACATRRASSCGWGCCGRSTRATRTSTGWSRRSTRSAEERPELGHVAVGEGSEVVLGGEAVLDALPRLGQNLACVGHVPVADVGCEQRLEARPHGQAVAVERERRERVVGLAAEVEALGEEALDVLLHLDAAGRELVVEHVLGNAEEAQRLVE